MDEFGRYPSGNKVTEEPEVLFARLKLDDVMKKVKVIQEEQKKAVAAKAEPEKEEDEKAEGIDIEPKAEITYDDFAKLQFQVGVILSCEAVPKEALPSIVSPLFTKASLLNEISSAGSTPYHSFER